MSDLFDDEPSKALLMIMEYHGFDKLEALREMCDGDRDMYATCLDCLKSILPTERDAMVNAIEQDYPRFREFLKRLVLVFVRLTQTADSQVSCGGTVPRRTVRVPSTAIFVSNYMKCLACDRRVAALMREPIDTDERRRVAGDCIRQCLVGMQLYDNGGRDACGAYDAAMDVLGRCHQGAPRTSMDDARGLLARCLPESVIYPSDSVSQVGGAPDLPPPAMGGLTEDAVRRHEGYA